MAQKFSSDIEIPKYLKQKENDISKADKKSKHKHQYEECLITYCSYKNGALFLYKKLHYFLCAPCGARF